MRVLLADDHQIFLSGLRSLLEQETGMEVVAEARDGREAVQAALEHGPDVVVMDVSMPGLNGIEATRQILSKRPEVKVLGLSMHARRQFVLAALEAGASGYLLKESALEELLRALRAVGAGQMYLSPAVAGLVVEALRGGVRTEKKGSRLAALTDREREVLQLIAEGYATREIADRMHVSPKTVGTHRQHLMDKLGLHTVAELTKLAVREGVTSAQ